MRRLLTIHRRPWLSTLNGGNGLGSIPLSGNDAALRQNLAEGNFTMSCIGPAGVTLGEIHDSNYNAQPLVKNMSSRGYVDATYPMIGGFVVQGGGTKKVLIRAAGPVLNNWGLAGLSNPRLRLKLGIHTIYENDNWGQFPDQNDLATTSASVGAFGLASSSSAMIVELPAGIYTTEVDGHGGSGIALLEVYMID